MLAVEYRELGRDTIDGIEVEGICVLCLGIHLLLFVVTVSLLKSMTNFLKALMAKIYWTGLVAIAIVMIALTHTIQV